MHNFRTKNVGGVINLLGILLDQGLDNCEFKITKEQDSEGIIFNVDWFKEDSLNTHFVPVDNWHEVVQKFVMPNGEVILAQEGVRGEEVLRDWEARQQQMDMPIEETPVEEDGEGE